MRRKKMSLVVVIAVVCVVWVTTLITLNAATSTHEAEADTNNLKYAYIDGDYVVFDAKKDAYVEMKKVNSPESGTLTLTFYYIASNSFPLELKVNGTTIANSDIIQSTSSGTISYQASMNSGTDNIIRFKIRDAVSGIKLDKVVISTEPSDSDSSTIAPTNSPTVAPTSSVPVNGDIILEAGGDIESAISNIEPGKSIYLKAGTYNYSSTIVIEEGNTGTSGSMKKIVSYGDGTPVIDFSSMSEDSLNRGLVLDGSYWHIEGLTIKGAGDNGMLLSGDNNIIEDCVFRENHDSGLQLSRYNTNYDSISQWPSNNTIIDCLSTENIDSGREDADGFAPKLTSGNGNIFENCKALYNCDDGWDMYTKDETGAIGKVILRNCEASGNGKFTDGSSTDGDGNGFKLGDDTASVAHELYDCVANNNRKNGYTGNGNPAAILLVNCTGSGNGEDLFDRLENAIFSTVESTTAPTSEPADDNTEAPTQVPNEDPGDVDTNSLIGFATLNGGTTGGNGGSSITVSNGTDLQEAIKNKGSSPLTIYINGTITESNSSDTTISIKEVDDVSIIGVGTKGEFNGIGIKIWKANNIIVRNLKIHHVDIGNKDCIGIEGPASNVWIDHCELYNDLDHDKDYYDGLLDAKAESEYITFSWNYLHDSYKTSLVGSSDSDDYDRKITYHHNKIENCNSRLPSYRFGTGHIYNNYYLNNLESGINSRQGAKLRIEGNYFKNIIDPIVYLYSDVTGYWDVKDNIFDGCSGSQPTSSTCSFSPPYSYDLDPASSIKSILDANVGVGKIN